MFELWKWLDGDKNFFHGVELLDKYCPNHFMLEELREGTASLKNRLYLETILKKKYEALKENPNQKVETKKVGAKVKKVVSQSVPEQKKELTQEDYKRIAEKELAKAYAERRRLSNQFHHCKTDEERANVSDAVKDCIENINSLKSRIAVCHKTGKMPEKELVKGFVIPSDALELEKMIRNFRAKVSTQKRLIKNYDAHPRKKSKAEHELKLSELVAKLKKLEDAR